MGTILLIVLGAFALLLVYIVVIYNRLVKLKNRFRNAFSQIDVQLKRRYDLIPNLVETARAYLKHEHETLKKVTEARNQALSAMKVAGKNPGDAGAMKSLMGAEAALGGALLNLNAVMENYPDLKADQTMAQLSEELTSTENKVSFARQAYNDEVMAYNTQRESFPDILFAGVFGFAPAVLWEIDSPKEKEAVQVKF
ncbi:MAG: LemA family protein [Mariprofundaceae bacterium]|nr:LemA family protein [Mariprofundaceae bacterium]